MNKSVEVEEGEYLIIYRLLSGETEYSGKAESDQYFPEQLQSGYHKISVLYRWGAGISEYPPERSERAGAERADQPNLSQYFFSDH